MGIGELWEVLAPGFRPRIPFDAFVANFVKEHGRFPRIALDAYLLIILSSTKIEGKDQERIIKKNFMTKLLYLVECNVLFVVVFDGAFKPMKKDELVNTRPKQFENEIAAFLDVDPINYSNGEPELIKEIKLDLKNHSIDYWQAPAEGESECANLQRLGIVDYVLTNDSDLMVFGATKVLRNFNRYLQDEFPSPTKSPDLKSKYYVTPVHMDEIEETLGMNRQRLVLLAALRGGDYDKGIWRIGIKHATRLALCGAKPVDKYGQEPILDFAMWLSKCFFKEKSTSIFGFETVRDTRLRKIELAKLTRCLNRTIKHRSKEIFGRQLNLANDLHIDEYYCLEYFFPRVNFKTLFKFSAKSLSSGSLAPDNNDIKFPRDLPVSIVDESTDLIERVSGGHVIGQLVLTYESNEIHQEFRGLSETIPHLFIPEGHNYSIKTICMKLLSINLQSEKYISIVGHKTEAGIDYLRLNYNIEAISQDLVTGRVFIDLKSGNSKNYLWMPRDIVSQINSSVVESYFATTRKKVSPSKKRATQKTTLDRFGKFPRSPLKRERCREFQPRNLNLTLKTDLKPTSSAADFFRSKSPLRVLTIHSNVKSALAESEAKITESNPFSSLPTRRKIIQIDSDEEYSFES